MQFSETVIAAMIGAIATVSTALFQLFTALRSRNKLEMRPKKGTTLRSIVAVIALMVASGVGGYLYSGMRQQSASEDLRSMREELNAKLQLLATTTERLAQARDGGAPAQAAVLNAVAQTSLSTESVIYAPGCSAGAACSEPSAQKSMVCGAVPSAMQVRKVELYAKGANAPASWAQSTATFEQDLGGAKFTGAPSEHAQDENNKAVCVDFLHWSAEPHLARLVLQYGAADAVVPPSQPTSVAAAAAPASALTSATAQGISLVSPTISQ